MVAIENVDQARRANLQVAPEHVQLVTREAAMLKTQVMVTPVGTLQLFATQDALTALALPDRPGIPGGEPGSSRILARVVKQLDEYFAGVRRVFDLPLDPPGTEFQRSVWKALEAIPYGETCSYGELAKVIGRPSASRAVGAANGANPIAIILPCHRVIGANGTLTGYGGGLPLKRRLLALEQGAGPLFAR